MASEQVTIDNGQVQENSWTSATSADSWLEDFQQQAQKQTEDNEKYNQEFWNRLQEEWKKISDENDESHPWLSDFSNYYDPYKEYTFDEDSPKERIDDAFEKGKQYLAQGDIPTAVFCFESAVKQHPENAEYWQYLGTSQAENEKDPNAIAALKKSLELQPNNGKVMMALAVSFTNESLQNQALKMLLSWVRHHPTYGSLVPMVAEQAGTSATDMPSSLIQGPELLEVQSLLLKAVQMTSPSVDAELQVRIEFVFYGQFFNLSLTVLPGSSWRLVQPVLGVRQGSGLLSSRCHGGAEQRQDMESFGRQFGQRKSINGGCGGVSKSAGDKSGIYSSALQRGNHLHQLEGVPRSR